MQMERNYPRHKVEYENLSEMVDVELDAIIDEARDIEESSSEKISDEEIENAKKVIEYYKDQLDKELGA